MRITPQMNLHELATYMGSAATEDDAKAMRDLLLAGCWDNVESVPEEIWGRMLEEIAK